MNNIVFLESINQIKNNPRLSMIRYVRSKTILPLAGVLCFALSLLLMTFVQVGSFIQGYSIAQLEHQQDELLRDLQALKLEEAVLKRPERIRQIATQELHLIHPRKAMVNRLP